MGPILLCHAFEDKKVVGRVYDALQDAGFEVWLDLESVFGEQDWDLEMARYLGQAACMLVFLSKNSVRKIGATHHEFGQLIETWKDMPEGAIHAIPVRINDCQIPDVLSCLDHIDLFEDQGLDDVIRCLHDVGAAPPTADAGDVAKPREPAMQDDTLDDLRVAVDGRGEVVDVGGDVAADGTEGGDDLRGEG